VNVNLSNLEVAHATQSLKSDQSAGFRTDVQGLRAIAVFAVILYHVNKNWLPAGFIGVDVFFVVSGYIVSSVVLGRGRSNFFRSFYLGRVRRIVPAYLVLLLFSSIITSIFHFPGVLAILPCAATALIIAFWHSFDIVPAAMSWAQYQCWCHSPC
jgi:peptidoglycan/LPS O-acetylase OafA/YrhL